MFRLFATIAVLLIPVQVQAAEHNWKMATSWSGGSVMVLANMYVENLAALTNGNIKIRVFPGGTLGDALKVTETVKNGVAQISHSVPQYDWGKGSSTTILGGYPGSIDREALITWLYEGGGLELWREYRLDKFGVVSFPVSISMPEIMHSKTPIKTIDDFKGLKIRGAGAWIAISKELGASPVTSSGAEVYTMFERGVVDAIDWHTPWADVSKGFHEISKYVIAPSAHQPYSVFEITINKKAWAKLSEHDKKMVEMASRLTMIDSNVKYRYEDSKAMKIFKDSGSKIISMDDELVQAIRDASHKWAEGEAEKSEWFAKIYNHQNEFMKIYNEGAEYRNIGAK